MYDILQCLPQFELSFTGERDVRRPHRLIIVINADLAWMGQEIPPRVLANALVALWNDPCVESAAKPYSLETVGVPDLTHIAAARGRRGRIGLSASKMSLRSFPS